VSASADVRVARPGGGDAGIDLEDGTVGDGAALTAYDQAHGVITDCQSGRVDAQAGSIAAGDGAVEAPLMSKRTGAAGDRGESGVAALADCRVVRRGGGDAGIVGESGAVGLRGALTAHDNLHCMVADCQSRRVDIQAGRVAAAGRAVEAPSIAEWTGAAGEG